MDRSVLLAHTRAAVEIRRQLAEAGCAAAGTFHFCYVLLLQSGHVYVGATNNIYSRLLDHWTMSPSSARWVKMHGPPVRVIEIAEGCREGDEAHLTLVWMQRLGVDMVRGACWAAPQSRRDPVALRTFDPAQRTLTFLPRGEVDAVTAEVVALAAQLPVSPLPPQGAGSPPGSVLGDRDVGEW